MSQLKEYFFGKSVKSKPDEQFTIKLKKSAVLLDCRLLF